MCCGLGTAAPTLRFCMECNFAGAQLAGSDFSGVNYVGANFAGAVLTRASFRDARLVAANFAGADLRDVAFDASECTACNFQGAKLDRSTFTGTRMTAANFAQFDALVSDDQLRELLARCAACNFQSARLAGRNLASGSLIGVDFSKADLRGTQFDGAVICWYVMNGAQQDTKCDNLRDAQVIGASFARVRVCSDPGDVGTCSPVSADTLRRLSGSTLSGATLP
jgi:uncharacterized protein YjbI with pentapeptide repeats